MYVRRLLPLFLACGLSATLTMISPPSVAQDTAEASDEQIELNDEALEAMNDGNYVRAASLLEESIHLGELNVTYLNLGRAYQLMGRCKAAEDALEKARSAPQAASPAPELVDKKIGQYLADIDASCEPDGATDSETTSTTQPPDEATEPDPPRTDSRRTWGYAALGSGVAVGVGAGLLSWGAASLRDDIDSADTNGDGFADELTRQQALQKQDSANLYDSLAVSGAVVGGALIGTGLYLLFSDGPTTSQVSIVPGPESVNMTWSQRF